jgi:hypothetical protein
VIFMLLLWAAGAGVLTYALHNEGIRLSTKPAPDTHETGTHTAPSTNSPKPKYHYCGTCREKFSGIENPPYGVIHVLSDPPEHLHPITRIPLRPMLTREESV